METNRYKYPRTPHLPWSPGYSEDDIAIKSTKHFENKEIIVTEKLDGENTTMYSDYIHARSIDSRHHSSRDWVKNLHSNICHLIPLGWRLCGENLYARHSIPYEKLESYFYLFSVWNEKNNCLDWPQTLEWATLLGLKTPKEFYRGVWNERIISQLTFDETKCEGYVVRTAQGFSYDSFSRHLAKWVRKGHICTDKNWMHEPVKRNS